MFNSRRIAELEERNERLSQRITQLENSLTLMRNPSKFKVGDRTAYEGLEWTVVSVESFIPDNSYFKTYSVQHYITLYSDKLKKTVRVHDSNLCK